MSKEVLHAPAGKTDSDIVQSIEDRLSVEPEAGGP
jgi:hypothetical protein